MKKTSKLKSTIKKHLKEDVKESKEMIKEDKQLMRKLNKKKKM